MRLYSWCIHTSTHYKCKYHHITTLRTAVLHLYWMDYYVSVLHTCAFVCSLTWQPPVSLVSFGSLAALAVCAQTEPGDLVWGDVDWVLQQHLAVDFQVPGWGPRRIVSDRVKKASGAVNGGVGRWRRSAEGWLPAVLRQGLRHCHDDREGNCHQHEVKKKGRHGLYRRTTPVTSVQLISHQPPVLFITVSCCGPDLRRGLNYVSLTSTRNLVHSLLIPTWTQLNGQQTF